jgi:hypothetical protein
MSTIEKLNRMMLALGAALLLLSACTGHDGRGTSASAAPSDQGITADSLIVNLDDARRIADYPGLTSRPALDVHQPSNDHTNDSDFPKQCQVAFDQDVEFGSGLTQFRSVDYSGSSNYGIAQAVGVYSDEGAARAAFDRISSSLNACSARHAEHFMFTLKQQDSSTLALCREQCRDLYRVKKNVVIDVSAHNFPNSEAIAAAVLQTITDRIDRT